MTLCLGIFSTLNGPGSRAMVAAVADACASGMLPNARVLVLCVDRAEGESVITDAAVAELRSEYGLFVVRTSAFHFERTARRAARVAAAAGDPGPLAVWRDAWAASYARELPATDMDLLLGDMWVWGPAMCQDRCGLNLHPALPTGPLGKLWYEVIWDLIEADAAESGVMLHRVVPEVDAGPVVTYCRYPLHRPSLDELWASLPDDPDERRALIAAERARGRESEHPLFHALRTEGLAREVPLVLATVRGAAEGRVLLVDGAAGDAAKGLMAASSATDAVVTDAGGTVLVGGLDLTEEVNHMIGRVS